MVSLRLEPALQHRVVLLRLPISESIPSESYGIIREVNNMLAEEIIGQTDSDDSEHNDRKQKVN